MLQDKVQRDAEKKTLNDFYPKPFDLPGPISIDAENLIDRVTLHRRPTADMYRNVPIDKELWTKGHYAQVLSRMSGLSYEVMTMLPSFIYEDMLEYLLESLLADLRIETFVDENTKLPFTQKLGVPYKFGTRWVEEIVYSVPPLAGLIYDLPAQEFNVRVGHYLPIIAAMTQEPHALIGEMAPFDYFSAVGKAISFLSNRVCHTRTLESTSVG